MVTTIVFYHFTGSDTIEKSKVLEKYNKQFIIQDASREIENIFTVYFYDNRATTKNKIADKDAFWEKMGKNLTKISLKIMAIIPDLKLIVCDLAQRVNYSCLENKKLIIY